MPNHITNRLTFSGETEKVKQLIEKYGTQVPKKLSETYDNIPLIICENEKGEHLGWYDEKEKVFTFKDKSTVKGLPDGIQYKYEEAYTIFPDFNKIIPMPETLNIESGSMGDTGYEIITGDFGFLGEEEIMKRFYKMAIEDRIEALELGIKYAHNKKLYGHKTWYSWANENWGTKWNSYSHSKVEDNVFEFQTAWSDVHELIEKISIENKDVHILYQYSDEDIGANCGETEYKNGVLEQKNIESCSLEAYEIAFLLHPESKEDYELKEGAYQYIDE